MQDKSTKSRVPTAPALRVLPGGATPHGDANSCHPQDFDAVFRRYAPYVGSIALKILGRDEDVDDVVQEVFCVAHRSLGRLRDPRALKGWLARIAVRRARRRLERSWWRRWAPEPSPGDCGALVDPRATPEQRAEVATIYAILQRMPAPQRIAWVLRHVEGEELAQVATLCGCSLSTAQRRLRAADSFLERALRDD